MGFFRVVNCVVVYYLKVLWNGFIIGCAVWWRFIFCKYFDYSPKYPIALSKWLYYYVSGYLECVFTHCECVHKHGAVWCKMWCLSEDFPHVAVDDFGGFFGFTFDLMTVHAECIHCPGMTDHTLEHLLRHRVLVDGNHRVAK